MDTKVKLVASITRLIFRRYSREISNEVPVLGKTKDEKPHYHVRYPTHPLLQCLLNYYKLQNLRLKRHLNYQRNQTIHFAIFGFALNLMVIQTSGDVND